MPSTRHQRRLYLGCVLSLGWALFGSGHVDPAAKAAVMPSAGVRYSTTTTIGGGSGANLLNLSFAGVDYWQRNQIRGPGAFELGTFYTNGGFPEGSKLTVEDLPFTVTLSLYDNNFDDYYYYWNPSATISITGTIEGTVTGKLSSLTATVDSVSVSSGTPPFDLKDVTILSPQTIGLGQNWESIRSPLIAHLATPIPAPVPEPTALAVLGVGFAGVAWRLSRQRRERGQVLRPGERRA